MANRSLTRAQRQIYSKTSYMTPYKEKVMVKLSDVTNPVLTQALQSLGHKEVDMKTAWALSKIMEERVAHLKTLENTRKVLLDKYCDKDEKGEYCVNETKTQYLVKDEVEYNKEYAELVDIEVEVTMLKQDLVDKIPSITPAQLLALKPFIH